MKQINVTLDIYSSLICLIIVIYIFFSDGKKDKLSRYFMYAALANVGMLLGDIPAWVCEGFAKPWYPAAMRYGSLLFWCCTAPLQYYYTCYVIEYISQKTTVPRAIRPIAGGLCLFHLICSVLSLWNSMFWYIGDGNTYQRGSWFFMSQFVPFIVYTIDAVLVIYYRKYMPKKDIVFFLSYIFLPIFAQFIQIFNFGIALVNTGAGLAMLLIFINIQHEQELRLRRQEAVMRKQEKELVESRVDIMLSQIQPHFLYNTLTAIRQLCDIDPEQAKQAVTDFSRFLRSNMNALTNKAPIPFRQELAHAKNYLNLESQRFGDRIKIVYDINATDFVVPPLTLQPIVENAVRHGVIKRLEGGVITISSVQTESSYIITVSDNGVGFSIEDVPQGERIHVGIENVRHRLDALCDGTLDITSVPNVGTTAVITVPKITSIKNIE